MDPMWIATIVAGLIPPAITIGALTLWYASKRRKLAGRRVDVTWFDGTTTLKVEAQPKMHAGFGRRDRPPQVVDEANEGGRRVVLDAEHVAYGETRGDVHLLVSQDGVSQALDLLLSDDERSLRSVDVVPNEGVVWFARNLREVDMTPGWTRRLVDAAIAIARAAERPSMGFTESHRAEA
jgi:hypothetical protein